VAVDGWRAALGAGFGCLGKCRVPNPDIDDELDLPLDDVADRTLELDDGADVPYTAIEPAWPASVPVFA